MTTAETPRDATPRCGTTYSVSLLCRSKQPLDELAKRFYDRHDGVLAERDGTYSVTLFMDASGERAWELAVDDVEAVGLRVRGVDLDLVDTSEIAARAGVTRQAVNHWADGRRGTDFPAPMGSPGGRRIWSWGQLVPWLKDRDLLVEDEPTPLTVDECAELHRWIVERRRLAKFKTFSAPVARTGVLGVKNVPAWSPGSDAYEQTSPPSFTAK